MHDKIEKRSHIKQMELSEEFYFQSLLEQAHIRGMLAGHDIERLQHECLALLAEKTESYTRGESSSIPVEKAEGLMQSNLYTIGLWLKTYANPDDAVRALQAESIQVLYQKGRKRIDKLLSAAKLMHKKLEQQLIQSGNVFHRETLINGISGFFQLYRPDYAAQEIHITADYPLYHSQQALAGIEFISAYIKAAFYENAFCVLFAPDAVHHLLCGFAEGYEEHLFNLYEPVLLTAIGCVITGADIRALDLSGGRAEQVQSVFSPMQFEAVSHTVQKAGLELIRCFELSGGLASYVQSSLHLAAQTIGTAAREGMLHHVFVLPAYPENNPKLTVLTGHKMDNGNYKRIIDTVNACVLSESKTAVIRESIHSLADLEDVLLDAELSIQEIQAVLKDLALPELAAFLKKYPADMDTAFTREQEQRLQQALHGYLQLLPKKQQETVKQASRYVEEK